MNELVSIVKNNVVVSSLQVAEHFNKRHDKLFSEIERMYGDLTDTSGRMSKMVETPFFYLHKYRHPQNGQIYQEWLMNRDGFSLLVMGFTGKKALEWKLKYIEAFNCMERLLAEKQTEEWQKARIQGKGVRREFTDAIKEFVELAESQGHHGTAKFAYSNFSKLIKKPFGTREGAGAGQLAMIAATEHVLGCTIFSLVRAGGDAKDIYNNVRDKAHALTGIMLPALGT